MTEPGASTYDWIAGWERRRRNRGRVRRALRLRRPRRLRGPLWYELLIWACRNNPRDEGPDRVQSEPDRV